MVSGGNGLALMALMIWRREQTDDGDGQAPVAASLDVPTVHAVA
jgi:hypothetical protein